MGLVALGSPTSVTSFRGVVLLRLYQALFQFSREFSVFHVISAYCFVYSECVLKISPPE